MDTMTTLIAEEIRLQRLTWEKIKEYGSNSEEYWNTYEHLKTIQQKIYDIQRTKNGAGVRAKRVPADKTGT
jgi:hypothetical protein